MEKDINQSKFSNIKDNMKDNSIGITNVFNIDPYLTFALKKSEKISKAFYLVTNFLDVREPLKWRLRDLSLTLLSRVGLLASTSLSDREKIILDIKALAGELYALTSVSSASGFLSSMNAGILESEIASLVMFLEEKQIHYYASISKIDLNKDFFEGTIEGQINIKKGEKYHEKLRPTSLKDRIDKKDILRTNNLNTSLLYNSNPIRSIGVENFTRDLEARLKNSTSIRTNYDMRQSNNYNQNRRNKIIELASEKDSFSIRDISDKIKDCSEKTIQRELILMVKDGTLVKEGERRWSKYSLNRI